MYAMKKLLLLATVALAGCITAQPPPNDPSPYNGLQISNYTNGLSNAERNQYYYMDEGIQYLPVDVILSLDRPLDTGFGLYDERFFAHPERLGLYPNLLNNSSLPIGITASQDPEYARQFGINCSTCHTSMITYQGRAILVDGNSGLFAIDRLIKEMIFSVAATMVSPTEFDKFYSRYQALNNIVESEQDKKDYQDFLKSDNYTQLQTSVNTHVKKYHPDMTEKLQKVVSSVVKNTTLTSGAYPTKDELSSRLKMFGYLAKRLLFFYEQTKYASSPNGSTVSDSGLGRSNPWSVVKNMLADHLEGKSTSDFPQVVGGPINTPSIWRFDRSERIFWMGVTNSMEERNLAQGVSLITDFNWDTYETTISVRKLRQISAYAKKITPPVWPSAILGSIDQGKAALGKVLFKKNCLNCHADALTNVTASFKYNYMDVGTDPNYYNGQVESFYGKDLFKDELAPWLKKVKAGAYTREKVSNPNLFEYNRLPVIWEAPAGNKPAARPLYGIWASAPYLHNGSVSSIKELLNKPADRKKSFYVGSTEFDPVDLGFKDEELYFSYLLQVDCATCTGNSNQGHDFGTNLTEDQKYQLIEFLKSYTVDTEF